MNSESDIWFAKNMNSKGSGGVRTALPSVGPNGVNIYIRLRSAEASKGNSLTYDRPEPASLQSSGSHVYLFLVDDGTWPEHSSLRASRWYCKG